MQSDSRSLFLREKKVDIAFKEGRAQRLIPLFDTLNEVDTDDLEAYIEDRPYLYEYFDHFQKHLDAAGDFKAVHRFLRSHSNTPTTFNNYRTQVERLLLWSWNVHGTSIFQLKQDDLFSFLQFCKEPDSDWVGAGIKSRFVLMEGLNEPNVEWRPFAMRTDKATAKNAIDANKEVPEPSFSMADSSLTQVFGSINSLFQFCVLRDLAAKNPCVGMREDLKKLKSRTTKQTKQKSLSKLQWNLLLEAAEINAEQDQKSGERTLFIIVMMFGSYLRVSDLVGNGVWTPSMGDFRYEREAWWYYVCGKGGVEAKITVKPDCMAFLKRYRQSRGLSPYPKRNEAEPLLRTAHGRAGLTARQIRRDVQAVLDLAASRMKEEGFPDYEIEGLREASLHSLRHTGATFDAPHRSPKHLQADLRHKSLATTQDVYYNTLDDERSNEAANLTLRR